MIKISVICVGKIKEKYWNSALDEYTKRLSRYCKLEIIEVADEKTPENAPPAIEEMIKQKEAQRILKYVYDQAKVYVLAIEGKKLDSVSFSKRIQMDGVNGESNLQFIIGGSLGLDKSVYDKASELISFSDMTFPHQLMRVILLEQIYRGYRIMNGEPYHK